MFCTDARKSRQIRALDEANRTNRNHQSLSVLP
jgi:hypothetical protein